MKWKLLRISWTVLVLSCLPVQAKQVVHSDLERSKTIAADRANQNDLREKSPEYQIHAGVRIRIGQELNPEAASETDLEAEWEFEPFEDAIADTEKIE